MTEMMGEAEGEDEIGLVGRGVHLVAMLASAVAPMKELIYHNYGLILCTNVSMKCDMGEGPRKN